MYIHDELSLTMII